MQRPRGAVLGTPEEHPTGPSGLRSERGVGRGGQRGIGTTDLQGPVRLGFQPRRALISAKSSVLFCFV